MYPESAPGLENQLQFKGTPGVSTNVCKDTPVVLYS